MLPDPIAIIGNGLPAWLAADVLTRALGRSGSTIVLVAQGDPAAGFEALPPRGIELAAQLGYEENFLAGAGKAVPLLGTVIEREAGQARFVGYAAAGVPFGPVPFHHVIARLRAEGEALHPANFDFNALAAQSGRFAPPPADRDMVASALEPGLVIDQAALADFLRERTAANGLRVTDSEAGLANGLILDCRTTNVGTPDNADRHSAPAPLYSVLSLASCANSYALPTWRGMATAPLNALGQSSGVIWQGLTIDLAAAWHATPVHAGLRLQLLLSQLSRLLALLPGGAAVVEAAEFNRLTQAELGAAADWAAALSDLPGSSQLDYKRMVFADCGRVPMFDEEPVEEADWVSLFLALDIAQRTWDAQLCGVPSDALRDHCTRIRAIMIDGLRALPPFPSATGAGR